MSPSLGYGLTGILIVFSTSCASVPGTVPKSTIRVPDDFPSIQQAIDGAAEGETILVAPGLYRENLRLSGKNVILASWYHTTGDPEYIDQTILDGQGGEFVTRVEESVGPDAAVIGFTIRNAEDAVLNYGEFQLLHNRLTMSDDGLECKGGRVICSYNVFENNIDDGIDLDGAAQIVVENNILRDNGDDGIAVRLHEYSGPFLEITIRNNQICGNREDGIQLVGYPALSSRVFRIEFNVIANNGMAGVGMMSDGKSGETFEGAGIPERIYLINNAFLSNDHGVSGGHNVIALNNIIAGSRSVGIRNMKGNSIGSHLLFWNNLRNFETSNIDAPSAIFTDPLLDKNYGLTAGSPAIDAGTAAFKWRSEIVLNRGPGDYSGDAPDLGAREFDPLDESQRTERPVQNPK